MSDKRHTCGDCPHLHIDRRLINHKMVLFGCGKSDPMFVVPHHVSNETGQIEAQFWRIPLSCPLPDGEVCKRENQAPRQHWVEMTVPIEDKS